MTYGDRRMEDYPMNPSHEESMRMSMDYMERNKQNRMNRGGSERMDSRAYEMLESIYCHIDERMTQAICFHEQLADYFCFLGLEGYKDKLEYQYMMECADKRNVHEHYIQTYRKVLPLKQVKQPMFILKDWNKYTTQDIDDSIVPKLVRTALMEYHKWEEETKQIYEECCQKLRSEGFVADYEYVKELVLDVEEEIRKVTQMIDSLNGTGYDVNMIHGVQDRYHNTYKAQYDNRFTTKNSYRGYEGEPYDRGGRRRYDYNRRDMDRQEPMYPNENYDEHGRRRRKMGF